jgi:hypothetical protein
MRDIREILEKARVPDPGKDYWNRVPSRIMAEIESGSGRASGIASPLPRARAQAAAVVAGLFLLAVLLALPEGGSDYHAKVSPSSKPALKESTTTAELAVRTSSSGILGVLGRSAAEKAESARRAFHRGDSDRLVALVRSYEKILRTGILGKLMNAAEEDELLSRSDIRLLRESVMTGDSDFREMAAKSGSGDFKNAVIDAMEASKSIVRLLDERFVGEERG